MLLQCTMSSIFDWEVRRLGMRERVKTRNDNGLRIWIFSQKLPFSVEKKFRKYKTLYLNVIQHISDFVWFQRSCGSMKSVSSFSSIDIHLLHHLHVYKKQRVVHDLCFIAAVSVSIVRCGGHCWRGWWRRAPPWYLRRQ